MSKFTRVLQTGLEPEMLCGEAGVIMFIERGKKWRGKCGIMG